MLLVAEGYGRVALGRGLRPTAAVVTVLLVAAGLAGLAQPADAGPGEARFHAALPDELDADLAATGLVPVSAGLAHTCALGSDGAAYCWGDNDSGQVGDGTVADRMVPVAVDTAQTFTQIAAGFVHTCALDGDGKAYCWGWNLFGQVGNGSSGSGQRETRPVAVDTELRFGVLTGGLHHTCGLDHDGRAWCWGGNDEGQLGIGSSGGVEPRPVEVDTEVRFTTLVSGFGNVCGLDHDGGAWCWGENRIGQLGNGSSGFGQRETRPVAVDTEVRFAQLTSSSSGVHTCGVDVTGGAWCWGGNDDGQLGNGGSGPGQVEPRPVAVDTEVRFAQLAAGDGHTCGMDVTGGGWCWGWNGQGQLGTGGTDGSATPVRVVDTEVASFAQLASAGEYTCGVADGDGDLWCWGANGPHDRDETVPALGDGTTDDQSSPVAVLAGAGPSRPAQRITIGGAPAQLAFEEAVTLAISARDIDGALTVGVEGACTIVEDDGTDRWTLTATGSDGTCTLAASTEEVDGFAGATAVRPIALTRAPQSVAIVGAPGSLVVGGSATFTVVASEGGGELSVEAAGPCTLAPQVGVGGWSVTAAAASGSCVVTAAKAAAEHRLPAAATHTIALTAAPPPAQPGPDGQPPAPPARIPAPAPGVTVIEPELPEGFTLGRTRGQAGAVIDGVAVAATVLVPADAVTGASQPASTGAQHPAEPVRGFLDEVLADVEPGARGVVVTETDQGVRLLGLLADRTEAGSNVPVPPSSLVAVSAGQTRLLVVASDRRGAPRDRAPDDVVRGAPGGEVAVQGYGFPADASGQLQLRSTARVLGEIVTDDRGRLAAQVALPTDVEPGEHTLVLTLAGTTVALGIVVETDLPDVPGDGRHTDAIEQLMAEGVVRGFPDGTYRPQQALSRGQMASVLSRLLGLEPAASTPPPFQDVADGSAHAAAIAAIAAQGITAGCATDRYCPGDVVTRGQLAALLARAYDLPASDDDPFTDIATAVTAAGIRAAAAAGIISGFGDASFRPDDPVTRGQAATMLVRAREVGEGQR